MNKGLLLAIALFTVLVCCLFACYNPNIAQGYTGNFSDGEVFTPQNGHFDFGDFSLNSTLTKNFTAKIIANGNVQLVDDTGNITINYLELDMMIPVYREWITSFLDGELEKTSWTVDGVEVHEIDFKDGDLYSAYWKDSSKNVIIYISSPDERQTADMMNSLRFMEE